MSPRAVLLTLLPKVLLSRTCGAFAAMPLPTSWRGPFYGWFARRYGADLQQVKEPIASFRSLQAFFQRELVPGARPLASTPFVWPCDGRIVTSGLLRGDRIDQVKGRDYALADLLADRGLAADLADGSQATIYLAPGDYHRVHAPFDFAIERVTAVPGTLFPVNPPAVASIRDLFARNSRHVFAGRLADGRRGVVVMVGAYNVGGTEVTAGAGSIVRRGDELGRFGFGSTAIALVAAGMPAFPVAAPGERVWMGGAVPDGR